MHTLSIEEIENELLESCPICGEKVIFTYGSQSVDGGWHCSNIKCKKCNLIMYGDDIFDYYGKYKFFSDQEADNCSVAIIPKWNRRYTNRM